MRAKLQRAAIAASATLELLALGQPVAAQPTTLPSRLVPSEADRTAAYVTEASQRFGIPAAWIRAVMRVESAGEVGVTSSAGAMGLMQVMPQTYAALRARFNFGANPYEPHDNIMAGAAFLRDMHDRYGDAGFLAAYNAGPARYEEFRADGRPLPSETILYMARLGPMLGLDASLPPTMTSARVVATPESAPIFVALRADSAEVHSQQSPAPPVQVAMGDAQSDGRAAALFASRSLSPNRTAPTNGRPVSPAPSMQRVGNPPPSPVQLEDGSGAIFVPRVAGRTVS